MTLGVDPLDVFHNGQWYSRGGVPQSLLAKRAPTVAMVGHSIVGNGTPSANIAMASFTESGWITAVELPSNGWKHTHRSIIARAAMRSKMRWKMHRYPVCASGSGTSPFIAANNLPVLLRYNDGKGVAQPDYCAIFVAGNDAPATGSASWDASITNHRLMCETLLSRGIMPILFADSPRTFAGNQTEVTRFFERWAYISRNLAKEYGALHVDLYSATVNSSNGQDATGVTYDGTHLTNFGAEIAGFLLNEAIQSDLNSHIDCVNVVPAWTDSTLTWRSENMMLTGTLAAGTINTAGSRPTGYAAPGTPTMGTVYDLAGWKTANPALQIPHMPTTPKLGALTEPAYQGNVWDLVGNGTNNYFSTRGAVAATQGVTAAVGDLMAFYVRLLWLPTTVASNWGDFECLCRSSTHQAAAGFAADSSVPGNDDDYQIGGTADYPVGEFYQEFVALSAQNFYDSFGIWRQGSTSLTNTGDRLTIAAPTIINLTAAGLA